CGRKYVLGYGNVENELAVLRSIESERSLQAIEPQRILSSLSALVAQVGRRLDAVDDLHHAAQKLHDAMRSAYLHSKPAVEIEVQRYDPRSDKHYVSHEHRPLLGIILFGGRMSRQKVQDILDEATAFADEMQTIEISRENYERVASDRRSVG